MKRHLQSFRDFINEARDPTYYQETFYFTILVSMNKDIGGSRDETKNDIRALQEILTVTLVEPERGGIQRDIGTKYLSTLKLHVRKPKDVNKKMLMKKTVLQIGSLRGVTVLRYKEKKPKIRRKSFTGPGSYIRRVQQVTEGEYYQSSQHKSNLKQDFKELTTSGPQKKGGAPYNRKNKPDWEQAPPGAEGGGALEEDILVTVGDELGLMAFDVQPDLNQKIWDGDKHVRPGVKGALIDIIEEFLEGLELGADVKDIVLTGSLANYNWSKFSDIDLHILMDFAEINENEGMVKKFFDAVRSRWNKLHDIRVKGHEVEIYVQNEHEPHTSTGVYSLMNDEWIVKPQKVKPEIDKRNAQKKMNSLVKELDKLSALYDNRRYEESLEMAQRIKDKIKRMRQGGLEKTGIYSPENLAFKMLRRSGDIERLFSIYTGAYDQVFSLDQ